MQQSERFKLIPSVYALFVRDEKILLLRRTNTGFEDGNYGLVSGHAESGETMKQGMIREAGEEAGVKIEDGDMDLVLTMHRNCGDHERIDLFFIIKDWIGDIKNMEPNKCDDLSWFPIDQLPENIIPYIKIALSYYSQGIRYCEFGWDK